MNVKKVLAALTAGATSAAMVAIGSFCGTSRALADDGEQSKIRIGFEIAPVPLNLAGKDRALVGLGSYIVNAVSISHQVPNRKAHAPSCHVTISRT